MAQPVPTSDRPARRPTLKTIAEKSGLAMTTVSRALGDAPDISAKTKRLVRRIAQDVGYVPDRAGVRLRTGRTNVIALIVPVEDDALNMTTRLVAGIASALNGTPYHLVVVPEMPTQSLLDPVRYVVETRSADAVIFNRIQPSDPRIAYLMERDFPFATHGRSDWHEDHAWFDYDNAGFVRRAVAHMVERDRRNVVLIAPPESETYGRELRAVALEAAADSGLALHILANIDSDTRRAQIQTEFSRLLADRPRPDGIIAASPNAALAVARALEDAGETIGESCEIFAKETFPILGFVSRGIRIEYEDVSRAGNFLARAAIHEIGRTDTGHQQYIDGPSAPDETRA